uniref:Uncharacterized protein n=1 Tax=Aegilops tauschii subsp. strangulata TaxID=200361 RepID=A0A453P9Z4_AEGTS
TPFSVKLTEYKVVMPDQQKICASLAHIYHSRVYDFHISQFKIFLFWHSHGYQQSVKQRNIHGRYTGIHKNVHRMVLPFCHRATITFWSAISSSNSISQKLEFTSKQTIHQATEEKVVVSFSWHQDAIQAFTLRNRTSSLYINGVPYRFNMDTSKEYMPRVVADHYDYSSPKEFASAFLLTCS